MAALLTNISGLSIQQRIMLAGVMMAVIAAFSFLVMAVSKPRMVLLYGGLDAAAAGDVLNALEAMDVQADARGDAIYVPESKRDSARMMLAGQGLPQQGQPGFELLDDMNGFATTAEMFDAAYWRAKEGELARTILAQPGVRAARVHLAVPKASAFSRRGPAPSGSVTISMKRGRLDAQKATSIRYLVALAVPSLDPEQVAVIDAVNGVVLKPGAETAMGEAGGDDVDRSRQMEASLLSLLEARVGPGNARVSVMLDIDRERESVSERILDPESRVMMSREATEVSESDTGSGSGAVTVASNLPEGDASAGGSQSSSQRSETNEVSKFDISAVTRQREKLPGAINRVHVAVLIDEPMAIGEEAAPPEPRSEAELNAIGDLVKAAIGFDEERGDVVTVKSMAFHKYEADTELVNTGGIMAFLSERLITILQIVIPSIVVLILGMFVLRPILTQGAGEAAAPALAQAEAAPAQLTQADSPVDELRNVAAQDKDTTLVVLKSWLGDTEQAV